MTTTEMVITETQEPLPPANSPEDSLEVLLQAGMIEGFYIAERTEEFLDSLSEPMRRSFASLSRELRSELAAAIHLQGWEESGLIRPEMRLPSGQEVVSDILSGKYRVDDEPLLHRVAQTFHQYFSWEARLVLGSEILLDSLEEEEELAERLADFLWANRYTLE